MRWVNRSKIYNHHNCASVCFSGNDFIITHYVFRYISIGFFREHAKITPIRLYASHVIDETTRVVATNEIRENSTGSENVNIFVGQTSIYLARQLHIGFWNSQIRLSSSWRQTIIHNNCVSTERVRRGV